MKRVVIVQQYVPQYRVAFFEALHVKLREMDFDLVIAASNPKGHLAARNDAVENMWITRVPEYGIELFGRSLILGGSRSAWKHADGVIFPLQGTSLDAHRASIASMSNDQRIGLWGHVKSYVNEANFLDLLAERWLMRRSNQIFAYTPGGAVYARSLGVPEKKITTVMNAIDTQSLLLAKKNLTPREIHDFRTSHNLSSHGVYSFIGGLDSSKRISFIANVLDILWDRDPSIVVIVGGDGNQKSFLEKAAARGQVRLLGHVDDKAKALMSEVSIGILMPGRIGLIAVEALALNLPVLTTNWGYHAPENEYLTEGVSRFSSVDDEYSYVDLLVHTAGQPRCNLASGGAEIPTIDRMVQNYAQGVLRMFD